MSADVPRKRAKSVTFAPTPSRENTAFRKRAAAILGLLTVGGVYTLHYHGSTNGLFDAFGDLIQGGTLPGTKEPYRRVFTGIKPFDAYLSYFLPFFTVLADRSDHSANLFWLWMIGQWGIQWTMLVMESLRAGNRGGPASYIGTVGTIFQNAGVAVTIPIFLLINTLKSPISKASSPSSLMKLIQISSIDLSILPFSVLVGYFFPTVCMMLPVPAINSYWSRQGWIAAWQFFPLYTVTFQWIFRKFFTSVVKKSTRKLITDEAKTVSYFWQARPIYIFSLAICVILHLNVLAICLLPTEIMDAFPVMGQFDGVSFSSVFVPPLPVSSFKINSVAEGTHIFLSWDMYLSSAASLVWASLQIRNVGPNKFGIMWILKTLGLVVVGGPSCALVMALWERDSLVVDHLVEQAMKDK